MKRGIIKKVCILILILVSVWVFYKVNGKNYNFHIEIQKHIIGHPEFLPNKEVVPYTSFWFKNLAADMYWLRAIQYIGGNAVHSEYKKYLFVVLDLITELNPYFENPYTIGQLLLPDYNERYEKKEEKEQSKNIEESILLSQKGIQNFCDPQKLEKIFAEDDLWKIMKNPEFKNPCKGYMIPYYFAYIQFFYKNNGLEASKYYKVVSAQEDAPDWARVLAAIMQGKWGNREKSLYMFLSLAQSLETQQTACLVMTQEVERVYSYLSQKKLPLTGKLISDIENLRNEVFPKLTEENEQEILDDTKCSNYLVKAIRELSLMYIEQGNEKFMKNHPLWLPARNAKALYEEGYIDFLPTDYQQYEDYGIIYEYNYDIRRYDYTMGEY